MIRGARQGTDLVGVLGDVGGGISNYDASFIGGAIVAAFTYWGPPHTWFTVFVAVFLNVLLMEGLK